MHRLSIKYPANYIITELKHCECGFNLKAKGASSVEPTEKWKRDGLFIDKRGKLRHFNHKKVSRKKGKKKKTASSSVINHTIQF